ncbi:unnamed protein product [Urochloa humidicola]
METMESGEKQGQRHHFVMVHGVCHGAWSWYKVSTLLSSAGHRVTALDMAACGARPGRAEEVKSFEEYCRPLLDAVAALPPGEKAVLVAHSFGGQSLALAMERHPDKVAVAVFVSAAMPAAGKPMALVFQQALQEKRSADFYMDCKIETSGDPQHPVETFQFGPQFLEQRLYQLSPPEAGVLLCEPGEAVHLLLPGCLDLLDALACVLTAVAWLQTNHLFTLSCARERRGRRRPGASAHVHERWRRCRGLV